MYEAAVLYRSCGFAVLPLDGKRPHVGLIHRTHGTRSTKRLLELETTAEHLREWFSHPGVNIGIFCGEPSGGLVVVDLDDCVFPLPGATLPPTPLVKTGRDDSRGYHLYYRSDEAVATRKLPWGEVRAKAPAYVVAPPSVHPETGREYAWIERIGQLPLADFSGVLLPSNPGFAERKTKPNNPIRATEDVLLRSPRTTADDNREGWLRSFDRDRFSVERMAQALGINAPLGTAFPCVIHTERNASAALHPSAETGEWLCHDFHAARYGDPEWLTLAGVRAAIAGRTGKLGGPELATWKLILLVDAGLLPLVPVPAQPLPHSTPALLRHVYERFVFLLGCRWNYEHGAPAPFTREFAAALCGITARDAREAIDALQQLGAIYIAATRPQGIKRLRLWLPAGIEPPAELQDPDREGS